MKQIYEIRAELQPFSTKQLVSASYHKIDLESLCFVLSHLFNHQFIILAKRSDLRRRFRHFLLEEADLQRALIQMTRSFAHLEFTVRDNFFILYDKTLIQGEYFQKPLALECTYQDLGKEGLKSVNLVKIICYIAFKFHRSISCHLENLDLKQILNFDWNPALPMGHWINHLKAQTPGLNCSCFENVLHLVQSKKVHWCH